MLTSTSSRWWLSRSCAKRPEDSICLQRTAASSLAGAAADDDDLLDDDDDRNGKIFSKVSWSFWKTFQIRSQRTST